MTDAATITATLLRAILSRLLATGKTVVTESELVQIVRPIMIGDNTLMVAAGADVDQELHALAWRCAQLAAATPGLAVEVSVHGPGQFTLRVEHEPAERWIGGLAQVTETAARSPRVIDLDHETIGPDDPCWCGSGKKYKRCHGA